MKKILTALFKKHDLNEEEQSFFLKELEKLNQENRTLFYNDMLFSDVAKLLARFVLVFDCYKQYSNQKTLAFLADLLLAENTRTFVELPIVLIKKDFEWIESPYNS